MKEVKVNISELLTILRDNKEKHQQVFEEALEGYKLKVIETLERTLEKAKAGDRLPEYIEIPRPINQTHEYNRAIKMMEMSVESEITLAVGEFDKYVMDRWAWKQNFLARNSMYSATAAALGDSEDEE